MLKIKLIEVGKTTNAHLAALIDVYASRLSHYVGFQTIVIPELRNAKNLTEYQQKQAEAKLILQQISASDQVVLLDEHGKSLRSIEFAQWIQKKQNAAISQLIFVIGGPYGFAPEVYSRANEKLSISPMTFSHQLIRLLFVEQLYRAHTILHHQPYHHE